MVVQTGEQIQQAADAIAAAWHEPALRVPAVPRGFRPKDLGQAYAVQAAVSRRFGAIGGWRICCPDTLVGRACAPLPVASIRPAPARLTTDFGSDARIQPEICFRLQRDLPDYDAPYSRDQVLAAIGSVHPGVAMLHPGAGNHGSLDPLNAIAHSCDQRCLICGVAAPDWHRIDMREIMISVLQNGRRTQTDSGSGVTSWLEKQGLLWARNARPASAEALGGADDPIELVRWLANEGSRWAGGLGVGQWIAVSLGIDEIRIPTDAPARIVFGGLGSINLQFA